MADRWADMKKSMDASRRERLVVGDALGSKLSCSDVHPVACAAVMHKVMTMAKSRRPVDAV